MYNIKIRFAAGEATAKLVESETARDIVAHLPIKAEFTGYDGRECYTELDFSPSKNGEAIPDFSNGDVCYFPPYNTFAVFYARQGESHCSDLIKIGKITSGLELFAGLGETEQGTVELAD